jgi:hypothetical protein
MSPETVQRSFYKSECSTIDLSEKEANENKPQDLKVSPSQALYGNNAAVDCANIL